MKKAIIIILVVLLHPLLLMGVSVNAMNQGMDGQLPSGSCSGQPIAGVCFPSGTGLSETDARTIISNALQWIIGIFGILALIAFIVSGIQYLVSAGSEKAIETAKRNMLYSIIGVVVAFSAYIIIRAIEVALNASSTTF